MKENLLRKNETEFINNAKEIIIHGKNQVFHSINISMIETYWKLGERIVIQEQKGAEKAGYGSYLLDILSSELTKEFGRGFSARALRHYRQFYTIFPDIAIWNACVPNLTWTHYRRLLRVENQEARIWYLKEASDQQWSERTLDRNISTQYYERLLLSHKTKPTIEEIKNKTDSANETKLEFIKNPVVVEFLGLSSFIDFSENDLENAILSNLQKFIMELGKGYAFVARQQHIRTEENDYFIDLVFYNYILKCFVLIDLKTTKISYQDVGQMDMYLQIYDNFKKGDDDNSTIGLILCSDTSSDVAKYSTLSKNKQLFASKYKIYLPTSEELKKEIERQKEIYHLQEINNSN